MARKPPSSSPRGSRTPGSASRSDRPGAARRANNTNRGEAGRTPTDSSEESEGAKSASRPRPSRRVRRSDEQVWTPDQQASTRGRPDRSAGQRGDTNNRSAGQRDSDTEAETRRARGRDDTASGGGVTETGAERQGMGRGHRRNFDQSDDDAITRGQSRDNDSSTAPDSGVNRRSRPMDDSAAPDRFSSRGGRPGHRSDW